MLALHCCSLQVKAKKSKPVYPIGVVDEQEQRSHWEDSHRVQRDQTKVPARSDKHWWRKRHLRFTNLHLISKKLARYIGYINIYIAAMADILATFSKKSL